MQQKNLIPEWKMKYNIGIELVDLQHQYFLNLIKRLSSLLNKDLSDHMITRLINEILKYAEFHFQSEENLMLIEEYPEFDKHTELHKDLIEEIGTFLYYYSHGEKQAEELIEFLTEWFMHHTVEEDLKFGDYLKGKQKKTKQ